MGPPENCRIPLTRLVRGDSSRTIGSKWRDTVPLPSKMQATTYDKHYVRILCRLLSPEGQRSAWRVHSPILGTGPRTFVSTSPRACFACGKPLFWRLFAPQIEKRCIFPVFFADLLLRSRICLAIVPNGLSFSVFFGGKL